MVAVSSGSYQGRNSTQPLLFQQGLTNNESESQQQTPVSKYCNDRSEARINGEITVIYLWKSASRAQSIEMY